MHGHDPTTIRGEAGGTTVAGNAGLCAGLEAELPTSGVKQNPGEAGGTMLHNTTVRLGTLAPLPAWWRPATVGSGIAPGVKLDLRRLPPPRPTYRRRSMGMPAWTTAFPTGAGNAGLCAGLEFRDGGAKTIETEFRFVTY